MVRVLLISSHILGNATASRRYREVLEQIPKVELSYLCIEQLELDQVALPARLKSFQALSSYLVLRKKLKRIVEHKEFDLVICMTVQPVLALHGLFRRARIACWYDTLPFHPGSGFKARLANFLARLVYNRAFRRVRTLLPMSAWADAQRRLFSFPSLRQVILSPICVSAAMWRLPGVKTFSTDGKLRVLMSGNDARRKGFIDFFRWCQQTSADLSGLEFTILSNEQNPQLLTLAAELGINMVTDLTHDQLPRMISYYHQADIFFLPTKADMMPNVLIEAAAAKLPVLAANVGAISELLLPGKTGWLQPVGDWAGFYQSLIDFKRNPVQLSDADLSMHSETFFDQTMRIKLTEVIVGD